ncbi:MAG: single-stranded-DNA-specific exonuclease RecJ [Terriglobales bacterium]
MRWIPRDVPDETAAAALATEARVSPIIARLLIARGIRGAAEAQRFLAPSFSHLHSPFLMLGMRQAAERLRAAIARKEKILIYGDYDADGTIAVVVLKTAIELCGGSCEYHVPHRIRDGYGMKDDVLERAAAEGVRLIISVDTGIRAFAAGETARRLGLDLIVTDHHLPQADGVPHAVAVLNPNQLGCEYPCKALCGAGVAFKLAQAIMESAGLARLLPSFLKVVAIATIADAVPLVGENRVFAKLGLEALRKPVNPGLKALLEVAQVNGGRTLTTGEVAFRLAPRLNAAGRMDVARDVIDLFSVRDVGQAKTIAERLNRLNSERQEEEQRILHEIDARLAEDRALRDAWCMVVDGESWHKGVIGIAASRLLDRYSRPVLVITRDGAEAQGSARSIDAFHMLEALESCAHLFTRFGGHKHAAGFALPSDRIGELRAHLDARARACLRPEDLQPTLVCDAEIALNQVSSALYTDLCRMEPFGMGNPEPVFVARRVLLVAPPHIVKDKHVKLRVRQATSGTATPRSIPRVFDALGWRLAERVAQDGISERDSLDLAFTVVENCHPDFGGLELSVCDFARSAVATANTDKS